MKFLIKLKKCISIMTASCLLISFVIGPTAANAMTNEEATVKYKQIFKDFMLPYNYGQITSAHYAGTDRVIINIQDLHCHPKVQKNISNIIESFDKSYGVKKVYLEGAYGNVSTKWLIDRLDNSNKMEILDKILETGRLTGAEYYSVMTGKSNIINGLEEKGPYLDNLKRFGEIIENQDKINLILQAIDDSLSKLKKQYYTKRQYKLEELSNNYREGKISSQKYYTLLSKHIDKLGIDISKYENTFTYIMLLELQKKLDYSKITNELQNLVLFLRESLPNAAYQMLVDNTENFSKIDKLYGYIVRISRQLNLDLTVNFPNLDNYFGYIEFSQKINPLELIIEEKNLTQEINTRFSDTKAQREVVFLINFKRYLKDYVTSKITSDDYVYYKENIDTYRQLWGKYIDNRVLNLLDEYIVEADKFYKINTDRNIYFTRNMFKESDELNKIETEVDAKGDINKIIDNMKGVKELDIVITGGFHSQTVTEILKNHGVSYIVITPNVTEGTKLAEETYYEIAKEQSKISFQTLATLPFLAYPEKLRIRAAVNAFGADIAKEIFPDKIAEIDSVDTKPLSYDEKAIAQQMKKLSERIKESKFLESDDKDLVDFLTKITGDEVDNDLLKYINLEDLNRILTGEEVGSVRELLTKAKRTKNLSENATTTQQAIANFKEIFKNIQKRYTSQQEYIQKQELIRKINAVNLSFFDSKLLADIREESREKFDEIKRRFEGKKLESLSLKDLEDYWNLKKELLTIFEPKDEYGVKSVLEEVFSDIEIFISFIGNSAPKGDYAKIALSFSAAFANELNKRLGRSRLGIISSTTTDEGSIDAISTIVAQMYDALMVYVTAIDYLKYVDPTKYPGSKDFEEIQRLVGNIDKESLIKDGTNLEDFLTAFKFVAENGDIYSKSVARANNTDSSNVAVIIGGGNVAIKEDLKNAIKAKNEIFLVNSRTLAKQSQAPAMDHKKLMDLNSQYAVSNAVQYILNILDLFNKKAFSIDKDGHIIDINLPELELTDKEKEIISKLEGKKKQLAELRNKNGKNKTKEIRNLEREIDEIEKSLGQLKIFYYLLKEKILVDREKYKDVIELTEFLLSKFLELGKDIITEEDLSNSELKIHIFDMEDEHGVGETAEKEEETYKNAAESVAKKIIDFLETHSFFKKAWTYFEVKPVNETVKSEPIEREAFDLQYAIDHGYVVEAGKEKIETAGGKTTRTVYKLKDADSSQHYSKFILSNGVDGITDEFRTDVGTYTIDPMFVIYEDGTVGFMTQEDFKNVYGEKKKDIFKVTKKATTVEICFLKPRTIIQTKEGRVTVHSNEIVVRNKENNSIYAMSIEQFERIYPNNQENKSFYNEHGKEIRELEEAQKRLFGKQAETSQSQISDKQGKQVKQTRKKVNIRNVIAGLLLTVTLLFSALNITSSLSSAKAESFDTNPIAITSQEVYVPNVEYSALNIQQILSSDNQFQQLFRSLKTNNTMFAPATKEDLRISLQSSSAEEVRAFILSDIIKAASFFGLDESYDYDNVPEIIFMKTDSTDEYFLGSACAHSVVIDGKVKDFIIIPVNYDNEGRFILNREIFSTIVHEWTHVLNKDKVESGLMSPLEDEYEATRNGYLVLDLEDGRTFSFSVDGNDYTMPFELGMRVLCFNKILKDKNIVTDVFRTFRKDVTFDDLYYGKIIVKSKDGKDLIMIELFDTKSRQEEKVYAIMDADGKLTIQKGEIELENVTEDVIADQTEDIDSEAKELWDYLGIDNTYYRPNSFEDLKESVRFSNEKLELLSTLKDLLSEVLDFSINSDTEIIFMKGTNLPNNAACACSDINKIIICVDDLSDNSINTLINLLSGNISEIKDLESALSFLSQNVHEGTHLNNYGNETISPLEDERMAVLNEITVVSKLLKKGILTIELLKQHNIVISYPDMTLNTGDLVNHVAAMKLVGFDNVLMNKNRVFKGFRKLVGDCSEDIYYYDTVFGKNNIGITHTYQGLSSTQIGIVLVDNQTREKILAIIDTDIDMNTGYSGTYNLSKHRKVTFVEYDETKVQDQQEVTKTKDGKKTRKKVMKETKEQQQSEQPTDKITYMEALDIFERGITTSYRVDKTAIEVAFASATDKLNVTRENVQNILVPLADSLAKKRIEDVSTENNNLTFKILLSKYFQENKPAKITDITDYEDAMKMGRLLYYIIGDKVADLNEEQIEQILPLLMETYYKGIDNLYTRDTVTAETGFYCLLGAEEDCSKEGWESIFKLLEIEPKQKKYFKCKGKESDNKIAQNWLDAIINYPENKAKYGLKNLYMLYSGHGQPTYLLTGEYDLTIESIAKALLKAEAKGADLSEITLDLATCWSYYSSINLIELLKQQGAKTFPNIVTDAGYESVKGKFVDMKDSASSIKATDLASGSLNATLSNKEVSLIEYILKNKIKGGLSLADFHNAERTFANYTVFAVADEKMESSFENLRQKVLETLDISSDEINYGVKDTVRTEEDLYGEHFWDVKVREWQAKKGNMIYMELLLDRTKEILDKIGNSKIIKKLYRGNSGENFKNTRLGIAIGINIETFAFWTPNFVKKHNFDPSQEARMTAVVWKIRALSIGLGFGIFPALISLINPITPIILIPSIIATLIAGNIFHYFYDLTISNKKVPGVTINDIDKEQAIKDANMDEDLVKKTKKENNIMTPFELFNKNYKKAKRFSLFDHQYDGISLALTTYPQLLKEKDMDGKNKSKLINIVNPICNLTNISNWINSLADVLGVGSGSEVMEYMPKLFEYCKANNKKLYFFLPNDTKAPSKKTQIEIDEKNKEGNKELQANANKETFRTKKELEWITAASTDKTIEELGNMRIFRGYSDEQILDKVAEMKKVFDMKYVEFIVGTYDLLNVENEEAYDKYLSKEEKLTETLLNMLSSPEQYTSQAQESSVETQLVQPEMIQKEVTASIKTSVNPIRKIVSFILSFFIEQIKIEQDTIMVQKGQKVSVPENITRIDYEIDRKMNASIRGGKTIGTINGRVIKVHKEGNNIIFFSKHERGLEGIDESQIIGHFLESFSSGRKDLKIKEGTIVAFANKTDFSEADIQNRLTNAAINGIQKAEVEISLDLSQTEKIGSSFIQKCEQITKGQFSSTIIVNYNQLNKYLSEIMELQQKGYRFILRSSIKEIASAFSYEGDFHLDGAILEDATGKDLEQIEDLAADNVKGTIHIETQIYVNMATAKDKFDINNMYLNKGIIPIVTAQQAKDMTGKYAMEYKEIKDKTNEEIDKLLSEGKIINILCSDKKGEQLDDVRSKLAKVLKNMFGTMNELLKPKSPEQRISEEISVVSDYNYGEQFIKEIELLEKELFESLKDKNNIIRRILTTEVTEDEDARQLVDELKKSEIYKQLPSVIQMRIETEILRNNYFEVLGTIRGTINQIIDKSLLVHWKSVTRNKYLEKEYKEYRQYIRIRAIQLIMAGQNLNELLELRPDTNQSAEELFNTIKIELNKDVKRTVIANKITIKEITDSEVTNTITNFMNINILLEDSLIEAKATQQLQVSVNAVRSILAAA